MHKLPAIILITLALGAGWQIKSRIDQGAREAQAERDHHDQLEAEKVKALEEQLSRERGRNQAGLEAQRSLVQSLKQQLQTEMPSLEAARRRLEVARNRGQGEDWSASVQRELKNQREAVGELEAQLKSLKIDSAEIAKHGNLAQNQQRMALKEEKAELEGRIRNQEAWVRDTVSRIAELKKDRLNFDAKAGIRPLQEQLRDQRFQLQALKNQRPQLSAQSGAATVGIQSEVHEKQANLREFREQMEARLGQEKLVYADLAKQLQEARQDHGAQKAAMDKLKSDFEIQQGRVGALQAKLQEEEQRLHGMEQ
jgi:chromosome segregation ATPase